MKTFALTRAPQILGVTFVAFGLFGCGRPASEQDCQMIFEKSIEVEMRSLDKADPATLSKKQKELSEAFAPEVKQCVGKRVTEGTLNCIRGAKTPAELGHCGR
jgi:hypothetical protein